MAYIGNTVQNQGFTPAIDYFNGNGVTVTFTLSRPIASVAQVIVAVDNVIQNPSSAFNVVGNSITFTSAPLSGTNNIWVEYTSLITTYQGISQDPTVIGDIRATGGYLAEGDFGNSFIDGNLIDYVTGRGRFTVGELDDITFYHGGTSARSAMMDLYYAGGAKVYGTTALTIPVGTTAERPGTPAVGMTRFNSTTSLLEVYNVTSWAPASNNFNSVEYLVVAGGGGGGYQHSAGGGAGGFRAATVSVAIGTTYTVTIGAGGAGASGGNGTGTPGGDGSNSVFGSITSTGGGGGASYPNYTGRSGGSAGGGGADSGVGGSGTTGQGNNGGNGAAHNTGGGGGGGGGGAGAVGSNAVAGGSGGAGNGGVGLQSNIDGNNYFYAGGGGGGTIQTGSTGAGNGGIGGGGGGGNAAGTGINGKGGGNARNSGANGGNSAGSGATGGAGGANTGGGGGSAGAWEAVGGAGGSGIVIIRYPNIFANAASTTGSPTLTNSGGFKVYTFTSSGSITF